MSLITPILAIFAFFWLWHRPIFLLGVTQRFFPSGSSRPLMDSADTLVSRYSCTTVRSGFSFIEPATGRVSPWIGGVANKVARLKEVVKRLADSPELISVGSKQTGSWVKTHERYLEDIGSFLKYK